MEGKIRGLLLILGNNNRKKKSLFEETGSRRSKLGIQESTRKKLPEKLRDVSCWLHAQFSGAKGT